MLHPTFARTLLCFASVISLAWLSNLLNFRSLHQVINIEVESYLLRAPCTCSYRGSSEHSAPLEERDAVVMRHHLDLAMLGGDGPQPSAILAQLDKKLATLRAMGHEV